MSIAAHMRRIASTFDTLRRAIQYLFGRLAHGGRVGCPSLLRGSFPEQALQEL
jgi:hypothetical protein